MEAKETERRAYKIRPMNRSTMTSIDIVQGEALEIKVERVVTSKEPINDGAPEIYTERKQGVVAALNIRTDRFEIATEAMDAVHRSMIAKRDVKVKGAEKEKKDEKVVEMKVDKIESAPGKAAENSSQ